MFSSSPSVLRYDILLRCWTDVPERRPKFAELVSIFEHLPILIESQAKEGGNRRYSYPDPSTANHQVVDIRMTQPVGVNQESNQESMASFSFNATNDDSASAAVIV